MYAAVEIHPKGERDETTPLYGPTQEFYSPGLLRSKQVKRTPDDLYDPGTDLYAAVEIHPKEE